MRNVSEEAITAARGVVVSREAAAQLKEPVADAGS
jgi:hypothetical protein